MLPPAEQNVPSRVSITSLRCICFAQSGLFALAEWAAETGLEPPMRVDAALGD